MKISTKGRYALRVMLDLAVNSTGEYIPLKDIAARQEITLKYSEQVINLLKKSGFVQSYRGNSGGYRLAKGAEEYTAGDILRAAEGKLAPVSCLEDERNQCPRSATCPTLPFWKGLDEAIRDYVDSVTLQDLADEQKASAGEDCL